MCESWIENIFSHWHLPKVKTVWSLFKKICFFCNLDYVSGHLSFCYIVFLYSTESSLLVITLSKLLHISLEKNKRSFITCWHLMPMGFHRGILEVLTSAPIMIFLPSSRRYQYECRWSGCFGWRGGEFVWQKPKAANPASSQMWPRHRWREIVVFIWLVKFHCTLTLYSTFYIIQGF